MPGAGRIRASLCGRTSSRSHGPRCHASTISLGISENAFRKIGRLVVPFFMLGARRRAGSFHSEPIRVALARAIK